MKRLLGAVVAMLFLSGCRSPAPPNDPFLYRSTIPPPGTMAPSAPGAVPYYPGGAAPGATTAPPLISPGTPVSPAPLAPVTPATPPSKYSPPGGFNYQSSAPAPACRSQMALGPVRAS